jgi:uncharacterized membrane protein YsdA (DUF1294 family)
MVDAEGMMKDIGIWLYYGLAAYLLLASIYGFLVMRIDKAKAKKGRSMRRISERHLILCAALGGSIGIWIGMRVFRHKTLHAKFVYGVPIILLAQAAAAYWLFTRFN